LTRPVQIAILYQLYSFWDIAHTQFFKLRRIIIKKSAITKFLLRGGLRLGGTAAFLVIFALGFAGCGGIDPEDNEASKSGGSPPPAYTAKGEPVAGAAGMGSIKAKFGVTLPGKEGVSRTFKELSAYLKTDGFAYPDTNVINLGDYIDLDGGITVEAYPGQDGNGGGDFSYSGASDYTRLIVVGINSFQPGRGTKPNNAGTTVYGETDGEYTVVTNNIVNRVVRPHVVFQFQNLPVLRRMNQGDTNAGGYRDSEMRQYLLDNFLPGLKNAGVPEDALWGPTRFVSTMGSDNTAISDVLWLPTEREMFQNGVDSWGHGLFSDTVNETAANQARLEYYMDDNSRKKQFDGEEKCWGYWEASPYVAAASPFCLVDDYGYTCGYGAEDVGGCAPAFCIK
jgi:hypothetical protein